jgi:hypothetical protein
MALETCVSKGFLYDFIRRNEPRLAEHFSNGAAKQGLFRGNGVHLYYNSPLASLQTGQLRAKDKPRSHRLSASSLVRSSISRACAAKILATARASSAATLGRSTIFVRHLARRKAGLTVR